MDLHVFTIQNADTQCEKLHTALSVTGISLSIVENSFQKSIWIPAKLERNGALNLQMKNAHDLALLSIYGWLKEIDAEIAANISNEITRKCGLGCYVFAFGELDSESRDLWGVHLLDEQFQSIAHLTSKQGRPKAVASKTSAMLWLSKYFKNQLSVDYAKKEIEELQKLHKKLSRWQIKPKTFRILPNKNVQDPIPAELLNTEVFTSRKELERSLSEYRHKKPMLLVNLVPAIFVSHEDMELIAKKNLDLRFVQIHC